MRKKVINVKKINFKSLAKKIAIYGLAFQILLSATGCSLKKNYSSYEVNNVVESVENYDNSSSKPVACSKVPYVSNDIEIKFNSGIQDSLVDIDSNSIEYPYENLFNEEYSVNNFVGDYSTNKSHNTTILQGGRISSGNLYSSVIENNKNYSNKTLKEELSNSEIQKICSYIAEAINSLIDSGSIKDINEVACTLSDLKIFEISSVNDASVNSDNCLLITPKIISNNAKKYSDFDYYKYVIQHEAIHLAQYSCQHVVGDVDHKYGYSEVKDTDEVNMYEYLWLYEAHASKVASEFQNQEAVSYKSYVDYLNMVDYSNALNNKSSFNSLGDTALSRNINDLYSYFQVNSDYERREVDKFMFATDIALNGNKKFFNAFNKNNSGMTDSELKQSMKVSICEYLSKNFYKSLINNINNNSMNLDDIFYLISVFEAKLDEKIYYSSQYDYETNKDFFEFYTNIQNEFFELISLNSGITFDEVVNKFNNYSLYKEDGSINCTYNFNNNMKSFVNKLHTENTYFQGNIRQYSDYYINQKGYSK